MTAEITLIAWDEFLRKIGIRRSGRCRANGSFELILIR